MRIAVDARTIFSASRRGTGKNLIDLYSTIASQRPGWELIMFHQSGTADNPFEAHRNIRASRIDIPGDRANLWQDIRLPLAAWTERANVLHCPANTAPRAPLTPTVLTLHDLIPLEMAPHHPETRRWLRRVAHSVRRSRRIITPSHYTKRTIETHLVVPQEKITVNHWAPDKTCRRVEEPARLAWVRQKYGLPSTSPYVLAFGADDPRKNTARLLQAWTRVERHAGCASGILVVVGLQAAALDRYRAAAQQLEISDQRCLLRGFADEEDLPALMSGATALCYPSLAEGFGLPILDAFACGTPVITSATTSLPEVAGDAAILVDPTDPEAIARAMVHVLTSESVQQRLRAAGFERLTSFSWERCAATAASVLMAAAKQDGGTHQRWIPGVR